MHIVYSNIRGAHIYLDTNDDWRTPSIAGVEIGCRDTDNATPAVTVDFNLTAPARRFIASIERSNMLLRAYHNDTIRLKHIQGSYMAFMTDFTYNRHPTSQGEQYVRILCTFDIENPHSVEEILDAIRDTDHLYNLSDLRRSIESFRIAPTPVVTAPAIGNNAIRLGYLPDAAVGEVPHNLSCGLSLQIMTDPVFDKRIPQQNYEESWIMWHINQGGRHPVTRQEVGFEHLESNIQLKEQCDRFVVDVESRCYPLPSRLEYTRLYMPALKKEINRQQADSLALVVYEPPKL